MSEIKQIFVRVKDIIGRDDVRREELTFFFGAQSPLAILFNERLGLKHREFLLFVATCLRLSANNWTVAKLYDEDHPQECAERCMERSAFISVWHKIATCGLPKTRDEAANGEIPLWEDVQAKVSAGIGRSHRRATAARAP